VLSDGVSWLAQRRSSEGKRPRAEIFSAMVRKQEPGAPDFAARPWPESAIHAMAVRRLSRGGPQSPHHRHDAVRRPDLYGRAVADHDHGDHGRVWRFFGRDVAGSPVHGPFDLFRRCLRAVRSRRNLLRISRSAASADDHRTLEMEHARPYPAAERTGGMPDRLSHPPDLRSARQPSLWRPAGPDRDPPVQGRLARSSARVGRGALPRQCR
jgi:hypothetical protein